MSKRSILFAIDLLLSAIVFAGLMYYSVVSYLFATYDPFSYAACDIESYIASSGGITLDLRSDLTTSVVIPEGTAVHVIGIFEDGTVDVDRVDIDMDFDQDTLDKLAIHPVRTHGGIFSGKDSIYESDLFWKRISVDDLDSVELHTKADNLSFMHEHIRMIIVIIVAAVSVAFAASLVIMVRKPISSPVIRAVAPWVTCIALTVICNILLKLVG